MPRSHVIDGGGGRFTTKIEWGCCRDAALAARERDPAASQHYASCGLPTFAGSCSYSPLPPRLVTARRVDPTAEIFEPWGSIEIPEPLPRAFWSRRPSHRKRSPRRARSPIRRSTRCERSCLDAPPPAERDRGGGADWSGASGRFEPVGPSHGAPARVEPTGIVSSSLAFDAAGRLSGPGGSVPLLRANGRYWAFRTAGIRVYVGRYRPAWLPVGIGLACAGAVLRRDRES